MGKVVHTLPKGRLVAGVTSLDDEIYLLRFKDDRDQVEVCDATTYKLLRYLNVPNLRGLSDMTICGHYRCLYVADGCADDCVHRLGLNGGATTQWPINDEPAGLSVNKAHNVLVTCNAARMIKEFSSHGNLLREITIPGDIINPWHAVQLTSGQFIVCHGMLGDEVHRVCKISADGSYIVNSHGGQPGSHPACQYNVPIRLEVDDKEFVFVVDKGNRRVTLLSPTLDYMRQVVPSDKLKLGPLHCIHQDGSRQSRDRRKRGPLRLHLDVRRQRLYVAVDKFKDGKNTSGRVVVFSV